MRGTRGGPRKVVRVLPGRYNRFSRSFASRTGRSLAGKAFQSSPTAPSRAAIERRVKLRGPTSQRSTSSHEHGAETAAPGRALTVYAAAKVALQPLRPVSTRTRPPRSAFRNSCVSRLGWRFTSIAPARWANAAASSKSAVPSSRTTTWNPFEPVVFTQLWSPSSPSRSRTCSVAARATSGSSPAGSRSKTHTSGWSSPSGWSGLATREGHTCRVTAFWLAIQTSDRVSVASGWCTTPSFFGTSTRCSHSG